MSGHSKWSQIKRQKGVADQKRGQAFTKMGNVISIAVRQGGGIADPEQNFRLRLEIERARAINMPKENIERAIERGQGRDKGHELSEVVYEGFGPGGIAIIVEATTDNKQRTTPEIKSIFEKNGGALGTPGSVAYLFHQVGAITVKKNTKTADEIFLIAADAGALDVEEIGEEVIIYTKPDELKNVKDILQDQLVIVTAELIHKPVNSINIVEKNLASKILGFIDRLESHDDVQKVYANFDIPDEMLQ